MRSSCGESLRHTCGIERTPFHSKHHNLLEPFKIQSLRLIKKTPFEGWPLQKLFFLLHTQIIFAVPVVLGIYTCVYDIKKIYTQDLIYIHTLTI